MKHVSSTMCQIVIEILRVCPRPVLGSAQAAWGRHCGSFCNNHRNLAGMSLDLLPDLRDYLIYYFTFGGLIHERQTPLPVGGLD